MTRDRWLEDLKAVAEAERLYSFIGKYVICIQWFESKIDEMFLLARGHRNYSKILHWLAGKPLQEKIDEFRALVKEEESFRPIWPEGWVERFEGVIERLHEERKRRNGLLHASFLFDFLAIGDSVLRTHVKRREGSPHFDQEWLSPKRCEEILREVGELSIDLGLICIQLIAAYDGDGDEDVPDAETSEKT